jgi:prenylcysteine oxidase / farnesylcysteine lyase
MKKLSSIIIIIISIIIYNYYIPKNVVKWRENKYKNIRENKKLQKKEIKIGIIGSGIGGSSLSLYLRDLFGKTEQLKIKVFEKENRIGGRLETKMIGNESIDLGGACVVLENYNALEMIDRFNLSFKKSKKEVVVIWNQEKNKVDFKESQSNYKTLLKMIINYHYSLFTSYISIYHILKNKFLKIYEFQENLKTFDSLEEFLNYIDLFELTQISFFDYYQKSYSFVTNSFFNHFLIPTNLVNYFQNSKYFYF